MFDVTVAKDVWLVGVGGCWLNSIRNCETQCSFLEGICPVHVIRFSMFSPMLATDSVE